MEPKRVTVIRSNIIDAMDACATKKGISLSKLMANLANAGGISYSTLKSLKRAETTYRKMNADCFQQLCNDLGLSEEERSKLVYSKGKLLDQKRKLFLDFIKTMDEDMLEQFWTSAAPLLDIKAYIECTAEVASKDAALEYWSEEDGTYTVHLPLPENLCELFGLEPLIDDIHATAPKGSAQWQKQMRSEIIKIAEDLEVDDDAADLHNRFIELLANGLDTWEFMEEYMEDEETFQKKINQEQMAYAGLILRLAMEDRFDELKLAKKNRRYAEDLMASYGLR